MNKIRAFAVVAGALACGAGWAQSQQVAQLDLSGLPPRADTPARLEVTTATLPRFEAQDISTAQRTSVTLLSPNPHAIGLAVDVNGFGAPSRPYGAGLSPSTQSSVDLGLHWRHQVDSNYRLDVTAWRRMTPQQPDAYSLVQMNQEPTYGARVEVNLGKTELRKGFIADKGFVGLQLDNGRSITVRRKDGHPMIYYRVKF